MIDLILIVAGYMTLLIAVNWLWNKLPKRRG